MRILIRRKWCCLLSHLVAPPPPSSVEAMVRRRPPPSRRHGHPAQKPSRRPQADGVNSHRRRHLLGLDMGGGLEEMNYRIMAWRQGEREREEMRMRGVKGQGVHVQFRSYKASFGWGVLVGITQRVLGEKPGLHGGWQCFLNAGHDGCIWQLTFVNILGSCQLLLGQELSTLRTAALIADSSDTQAPTGQDADNRAYYVRDCTAKQLQKRESTLASLIHFNPTSFHRDYLTNPIQARPAEQPL
jgi:hypothetical protein